ncbi:MAG: LPS-assembly protein LptD, partial [Pontibacterium sp.]
YHGNNWALSGELHGFQTITADEKPYEKLPQIRLTGSQPIGEHSNLGYTAEYTYFTRDNESFTGSARVTGSRVHLAPALSYNYSRVWGYAKPQAKLWATHYELDDQVAGLDDAPSYSVPVLSFDSGLYFDRDLASGGVHSLEPRLFALYVPDVSQTEAPDFDTSAFDLTYDALFRDNRFSGKDRIGDAQQISLGVTNRFFRANGTEQAYISLGQAYYFDNFTTDVAGTQVSTASSSDIAMQSAWFYSDKTRLTLDNLFARSNGKAISSAFKVSHADGYDKQASLQYLYAENDHDQADLQFIWPLSQKWATIGRWHYDLESNENIERLVGLEYESCCWRVQTFVRDWLEDDDQFNQGVFLRFVLKGLGSIGTASEFLDDVKGFTKREERNEY